MGAEGLGGVAGGVCRGGRGVFLAGMALAGGGRQGVEGDGLVWGGRGCGGFVWRGGLGGEFGVWTGGFGGLAWVCIVGVGVLVGDPHPALRATFSRGEKGGRGGGGWVRFVGAELVEALAGALEGAGVGDLVSEEVGGVAGGVEEGDVFEILEVLVELLLDPFALVFEGFEIGVDESEDLGAGFGLFFFGFGVDWGVFGGEVE